MNLRDLGENMQRKSIMWFVSLACIAIGISLKIDAGFGWLFFGVASLLSLGIYWINN